MLDLVSSLNVVQLRDHVMRWDVTGEIRYVRLCHVSGVMTQLATNRSSIVISGDCLNER